MENVIDLLELGQRLAEVDASADAIEFKESLQRKLKCQLEAMGPAARLLTLIREDQALAGRVRQLKTPNDLLRLTEEAGISFGTKDLEQLFTMISEPATGTRQSEASELSLEELDQVAGGIDLRTVLLHVVPELIQWANLVGQNHGENHGEKP